MPRSFITEYIKHQRVQQACVDYQHNLKRLFSNEEGKKLLDEHLQALEDDRKKLHKLHRESRKLPEAIRATKQNLIDRQIGTLDRVITRLKDDTGSAIILRYLRRSIRPIVQELEQNGRGVFNDKGTVAEEYVKKLYEGSSADTKKRYEEMDYWYAVGQERAIEARKPEDRAYKLALIPKAITQAKWKFMLTLADVSYNIITNPEETQQHGELHNAVLTRLLSRLSMHERGADNQHMPFSHKLRHNPAIHSLHTAALADKLFHGVKERIEREYSARDRQPLLNEWAKLRDRFMLKALLHDMGELDGELTQGIQLADMTGEEKRILKMAKQQDEAPTFARHLSEICEDLKNSHAFPVTEIEQVQQHYLQVFHDAEHARSFIDHFLSPVERTQSQHDYLRFEGMNAAPVLSQASPSNKQFSMNYVSTKFRDAPYNVKTPGSKAILHLIDNASPHKTKVQRYLHEAFTQEYGSLMEKMKIAYDVPEEPIGYVHRIKSQAMGGMVAFPN